MALNNFDVAIREILKHEGGYVDHPKDPGGATNFGITQAVLANWRGKSVTKTDVKNLKIEEAVLIYKKNYWDKLSCDDLPSGVDYIVADFGVNSGPDRAARYLQSLIGATVDGKIGPKTIAKVLTLDPIELINKYMDRRLTFLKGLKTWSTFGKGWNRRVNEVRDFALKLSKKDKTIKIAENPNIALPIVNHEKEVSNLEKNIVSENYSSTARASIGSYGLLYDDIVKNISETAVESIKDD